MDMNFSISLELQKQFDDLYHRKCDQEDQVNNLSEQNQEKFNNIQKVEKALQSAMTKQQVHR